MNDWPIINARTIVAHPPPYTAELQCQQRASGPWHRSVLFSGRHTSGLDAVAHTPWRPPGHAMARRAEHDGAAKARALAALYEAAASVSTDTP